MSPRRSVALAAETRGAIIEQTMTRASVAGLDGVSFAQVAEDLQMSKSGVLGHFATKGDLQTAALQAAIEVFSREVWKPNLAVEPGLKRLVAICESWISYLEREVFPGGCFLTAASCEFDGRPGPVRDEVAKAISRWLELLSAEVRVAIAAGELDSPEDPEMIAFKLNGYAMAANQAIQLFGDRRASQLARKAMLDTLRSARSAAR